MVGVNACKKKQQTSFASGLLPDSTMKQGILSGVHSNQSIFENHLITFGDKLSRGFFNVVFERYYQSGPERIS